MKLNWKQITLGVLTYLGAMIFVMLVIVVGLFTREAMAGRSVEEIDDRIFMTTPILSLILIFDLLSFLVGAYVAAARSDSRKSAVIHACVMAVISTAIVSLEVVSKPVQRN